MRRTIMKKRVLQSITIGIAAMMASSTVPMTAFAAEGDPVEPGIDNENKETSENESISVSEAMTDCDDAENTADMAVDEISDAIEAVNEIEASKVAEESELAAVVTDLTEGQSDVTEADKKVEAAEDALSTVQDILDKEDSDYNLAVDTANAALNGLKDKDGNTVKVEDKFTEYNEADKEGTESSDNVIDKADTANTSDDEKEAKQAKSEAAEDLAAAEEALTVAANAYNEASAAVDTAQDQYDKAVEEKARADEALEAAKSAIRDADTNATAANERLKAAQAKVDALADRIETLEKNKEQLNELKDQYYRFMVHYYRDKKIASAVYDDEGKLDIEASAKAAVANGKAENPTGLDENTYRVGRELMKKLVLFELAAEGVDPSTIKFGEKENGLTKKMAAEGELTKDGIKDRVIIPKNSETEQWWDYISDDDGRYHNVKVTYVTEVDGEKKEVIKYYNYIFKSNTYDKYADAEANTADMQTGPVYLGEITKEGGKYAYTRSTEEFCFDDYSKILDAFEAIDSIEEYNKAKEAVKKAADDVDKLTTEIENLKKVAVDNSKIEELKDRLETARTTLTETAAKKQALEEKVKKAKEAYDSIDLSRFVKATPAPAEEPGTVAPTAVIEEDVVTPVTVPEIVTVTAEETDGQNADLSVSGAAEAAEAADTDGVEVIADAEVPLAETVETPVVVKKDIEVNEFKGEEKPDGQSVVIEDADVPLATIPAEREPKMNWWWLIIIAVLGSTGRAIYENYKEQTVKEETEEQE